MIKEFLKPNRYKVLLSLVSLVPLLMLGAGLLVGLCGYDTSPYTYNSIGKNADKICNNIGIGIIVSSGVLSYFLGSVFYSIFKKIKGSKDKKTIFPAA